MPNIFKDKEGYTYSYLLDRIKDLEKYVTDTIKNNNNSDKSIDEPKENIAKLKSDIDSIADFILDDYITFDIFEDYKYTKFSELPFIYKKAFLKKFDASIALGYAICYNNCIVGSAEECVGQIIESIDEVNRKQFAKEVEKNE